jgi:hypothetical protein
MARVIESWFICDGRYRIHSVKPVGSHPERIIEIEDVDNGTRARIIRTLAIVFPALGTATAAVVAFYGPQALWNQTSTTFASLGQLHSQISSELWDYDCKLSADRAKVSELLKDPVKRWRARYVEIQSIPNPNTQAGGGGSSTSPDGTRSTSPRDGAPNTPPVPPANPSQPTQRP